MPTTKTRNTLRLLGVWPKSLEEITVRAHIKCEFGWTTEVMPLLQVFGCPPFKEMMKQLAYEIVSERIAEEHIKNSPFFDIDERYYLPMRRLVGDKS